MGEIFLLLAMLAVSIVLVSGVVLMMRGGEVNQKYGIKLMSLRVAFQGIALGIMGIMFLMGKG